jgi:hypothetical protein
MERHSGDGATFVYSPDRAFHALLVEPLATN